MIVFVCNLTIRRWPFPLLFSNWLFLFVSDNLLHNLISTKVAQLSLRKFCQKRVKTTLSIYFVVQICGKYNSALAPLLKPGKWRGFAGSQPSDNLPDGLSKTHKTLHHPCISLITFLLIWHKTACYNNAVARTMDPSMMKNLRICATFTRDLLASATSRKLWWE